MNEYEQAAMDFLQLTNSELHIEFYAYDKHFDDDKEKRFIWNVTLKREMRSYSFKFGGSIQDTYNAVKLKKPLKSIADKDDFDRNIRIVTAQRNISKLKTPTAYDILTCLTKYDPGSFENFCSEFGYDIDSRKAEKTYNAVVNEWHHIAMLYNDQELEQLQEIQ